MAGNEGYEGDGVKERDEKEREENGEVEEEGQEETMRRDRERGQLVSTGVCMMGEAPPRLEFPLGLVLAI